MIMKFSCVNTVLQGRSPYDEELIENPRPTDNAEGIVGTGQQYDERGHPINLETRQRIRDHIRASNEVLHAAGIIEETEEVKARDRKVQAVFLDEQRMGRRRRFIGPMVLVAGVWGVCGMRRRILVSIQNAKKSLPVTYIPWQLYKSYSTQGVIDILQQEISRYSIPHVLFAGLPAFAIYQGIEWATAIIREVMYDFSGDESTNNESRGTLKKSVSSIVSHL